MADPTAAITELRELADRADEAASLAVATGAPDPDAVRALGDELASILEGHRTHLDPGQRMRLEQLAAAARSDDARKRPPARTFAARVRAATPTRRRPAATRTTPAIAVAALVAIAAALAAAPASSAANAPDTEAPEPAPSPKEPASVTVDGATYTVGRPGDIAIASDEWCEPPTIAVLRPSTGAIYRFRHLATPGEDVVGELIGTAADAVDLRPAPDCAALPTPVGPTGQPVPAVTVPLNTTPVDSTSPDTMNQEPSP